MHESHMAGRNISLKVVIASYSGESSMRFTWKKLNGAFNMNRFQFMVYCLFVTFISCFGEPTAFPKLDDLPDDGDLNLFRVTIISTSNSVKVGDFLPLGTEVVGSSGVVTLVWSFSGVGRLDRFTGSVVQFSSDDPGTSQVIVVANDLATGNRARDDILISVEERADTEF